ncbi:MAG: lipoate--protein ligase family protein [Nitrospirota bacterium]
MHSFRLLDLTLSSPVENLALDEALLDDLEENGHDPILRFWESDRYFVVLGRASSLTDDVHVAACRQDHIPVLRRASGGGTILQGPGCLSYAFVLPISLHPDLRDIRPTNRFILQRTAKALQKWQPAIAVQGVSDLAVEGLKISGNAQRRKRTALLFHGTILYGMQAGLIARYVKHPKRKPDYRGDRHHAAFLSRIDASPHEMKQAIAEAWHAHVRLDAWPQTRMSCAILNVVERSHPHKLEQSTT